MEFGFVPGCLERFPVFDASGNVGQYKNTRVSHNVSPGVLTPVTGTGAGGVKCEHTSSGVIQSAASGIAVPLLTLIPGNYVLEVSARITSQNNATLTASATVHVNGTAARITADNGGAMVLSLAPDRVIQVTQSNGATSSVSYDVRYKL